MPVAILTNPEAPLASAARVVAEQQRSVALPTALAEPVTRMLGKWLAEYPDCLQPAGTPDRSWCDAALRAHREGHRCETFRRRKRITAEAMNGLKWLALAAGYAGEVRRKPAHADPAVRSEAEKLMRGLKTRRITWDQTAEALKRIRSLVQSRGKCRASDAPVRDQLAISVSDELHWREVVTVRELASIGRANGLCTHEPDYARKLKGGAVRFFCLENFKTGEFLGLVSLRPRGGVVEGARAPGNEPLWAMRDPVLALLGAFDIGPGRSTDLLGLGLTGAVPDADLNKPDLAVGDMSFWFGSTAQEIDEDEEEDDDMEASAPQTAILVRADESFALLRPLRRPMSGAKYVLEQGHGAEFDGDGLLGRLLTALCNRTRAE